MNTFFIRLFFSIICLIIFIYILSFSIYEIKNKNIFGGIFTVVFTIFSIVFSNIIFWVN